MEYIVSGHSGNTDQTFQVPFNITLVFYAKSGETCYVPGDKESLDTAVNTIRHETDNTYHTGNTIPNYEVEFRSNASYEGVAAVQKNQYAFLPNLPNTITLRDICNKIQRHNGRLPTTIYCFFCRGSKREFADMDFGVFDETKFRDSFSPLDLNFESPAIEPPAPGSDAKKKKSHKKSQKAVKKSKKPSPPNKRKKSSKSRSK